MFNFFVQNLFFIKQSNQCIFLSSSIRQEISYFLKFSNITFSQSKKFYILDICSSLKISGLVILSWFSFLTLFIYFTIPITELGEQMRRFNK